MNWLNMSDGSRRWYFPRWFYLHDRAPWLGMCGAPHIARQRLLCVVRGHDVGQAVMREGKLQDILDGNGPSTGRVISGLCWRCFRVVES
jgi:hypothetical protein